MNECASVDIEDIELRLLLDAVFYRYHYDFRNYARASVKRRVRAALRELHCEDLGRLQSLILHDENAFSTLLRCLSVQVTDMFRNPGFFELFRREIIPVLRTYPSIRIWVAGCSTGEEIYSYAIILREEGLLERSLLYGTDISPEALRKAEAGVYSLSRMREFSQNHRLTGAQQSLSEHYTTGKKEAVFDRALKRKIVFADHSLATDNVFAEVQVVSCRNVLIYFDGELQNRALEVMTRALCRRGFLGLGARETLQFSAQDDAFEQTSLDYRWYRKK